MEGASASDVPVLLGEAQDEPDENIVSPTSQNQSRVLSMALLQGPIEVLAVFHFLTWATDID